MFEVAIATRKQGRSVTESARAVLTGVSGSPRRATDTSKLSHAESVKTGHGKKKNGACESAEL